MIGRQINLGCQSRRWAKMKLEIVNKYWTLMDRGFTERDGRAEMILKEVISIHRDMERETKQKDDKVEQVVNGQVDP